MAQEKKKRGRPSTYKAEIAEQICERLSGGESLRSICEDDDFPGLKTVMQWLARHSDFAQQYASAREAWADAEFESILRIADTPQEGEKTKTLPDGSVETMTGDMIDHRRLQIDTRKWALARMSPKKYGDRIHNEHSGQVGVDLIGRLQAGRKRALEGGE